MALELAAMRGVQLCAAEGRRRFLLRTDAPAFPALVARELSNLERQRRLEGRWVLRVHPSQMAETIYALEAEEGSATEAALEADLALLGEILGPSLRASVEDDMRSDVPPGASELTDQETEVLLAFVDGFCVRTMAERFHVDTHTVRNHLNAISQKLGVDSERELRELFSPESLDDEG